MEKTDPRCGICQIDFKIQNHEPRILPACGHSICTQCVLLMATVNRKKQVEYFAQLQNTSNLENSHATVEIFCPYCKSISALSMVKLTQETQILSAFPLNYELMSMIDTNISPKLSIEECNWHGYLLTLVCFDPECKESRTACWMCLKTIHNDCLAEKIVEWRSVKNNVSFTGYKRSSDQVVKSIDKIKAKITKMAIKSIEKSIAEFKTKLKELCAPSISLEDQDLAQIELDGWNIVHHGNQDS